MGGLFGQPDYVKCCCGGGGTLCCGRADLPRELWATITAATNCDCDGWVGLSFPMSRDRHEQNENEVKIWSGCVNGPCTSINGVITYQNMVLRLDCTAGLIGQGGSTNDLTLYQGVTATDGDPTPPCEDDLTGVPPNNVPDIGKPGPGSTCSPLRLIFTIADGSLGVYCQDAMAPSGVSVWTIEITE